MQSSMQHYVVLCGRGDSLFVRSASRHLCNHTPSHHEIVNANSDSGTNTPFVILTRVPDRIACTLDLHFFLSLAQCLNSSHVFVTGASISRSPSLPPSYISLIALKRSLSSSSLMICPSHYSRRALMDRTRLNVHDSSITSCRIVLPVMILSIQHPTVCPIYLSSYRVSRR